MCIFFSVITEVGIEVEEICYHDNSKIIAGIIPGLLQMHTTLAQPLGPLYHVTREPLHTRGKHRIEDHILHIKKSIVEIISSHHM
jgi:hypothetical protein